MYQAASLQTAQYRLARHYLNKLRSADQAVRRGQASTAYGLTLFDQEWEQIKLWQAWAAQRKIVDATWTQLCKEFPLAGLEVLPNRNNLADHVLWLEHALEAAAHLGDMQAQQAILHELNTAYFRLGALDQAEQYANQLLKLAQASDDPLSLGHAYHGLGSIAEERGLYAESKTYYQQSLEIFTQLGSDLDTGRALHGLGAIALYAGEYEDAYDYFMRSLELVEAVGSKAELCNALLSVSESLNCLNNFSDSSRYIQRAIDVSRTSNFQRLLAAALISMASLEVELAHFTDACTLFEQGIKAARSIGNQRNVIHGLSNLGYTRLRLGDYAEALARLNEGLQMAREGGMPRYICNLQRNLANTYLALHDLEAARSALHESLSLAQSLGSQPQKVRTLSVVVAYYHSLGRNEQAAIWAGTIFDADIIDQPIFAPVCAKLEAALGSVPYQSAIAQGRTLKVDEITPEIILMLTREVVPIRQG